MLRSIHIDPHILIVGYSPLDYGIGHVRVDDVGTVSEQECEMHDLPGLSGFHYYVCLQPQFLIDEVLVYCRYRKYGWYGDVNIIGTSVR